MIADCVAALHYLAYEMRIPRRPYAGDEECGADIHTIQKREEARSGGRIRPIVEGKGNGGYPLPAPDNRQVKPRTGEEGRGEAGSEKHGERHRGKPDVDKREERGKLIRGQSRDMGWR